MEYNFDFTIIRNSPLITVEKDMPLGIIYYNKTDGKITPKEIKNNSQYFLLYPNGKIKESNQEFIQNEFTDGIYKTMQGTLYIPGINMNSRRH